MEYATLRFLGELKDFLSENKEKGIVLYPINRRASIKDVIEALGPPHTEIEKIVLVNGGKKKNIDFDYILKGNEEILIFPFSPPVDVTKPSYLNGRIPFFEIKFVVDVNVGKLAKLLRMLGFDTAYDWRNNDDSIAELAYRENRILLTKDIGLLKRKKVIWGKYIKAINPEDQLKEVLNFFGLKPPYKILTRCLNCNSKLEPVEKEKILHRLEPKTKKYFNKFYICPVCDKIYWAGSHQEHMIYKLKALGILR